MKKTILLFCSIMLWQISYSQQVIIPSVIKGLTIMLAYQDYPFNDSVESVSDLMNKPGYNENGHLGSVRDYFYTQTNGKVTITSTVVKVTLSNTYQYYRTNNVNYVDEAIAIINQTYPEGFQDLTPDPVDGNLLHMNFIERGPRGGGVTNGASGGVYVKNNTTSQIQIGQGNISSYPAGIALQTNTICHEMGHSVMSWTDYYQTAFSNLASYDVMGSGGTEYAPQPINPALRMQRGWIDSVISISGTTTQTYTLTANSYSTIHKYTNPNNSKEYLLFYAYKIDGYYQSPINGRQKPEGLGIYYVDEESGYNSPVNPNDDNQYYIRLVQADNLDEMHDDFFGATDVGGDMEDLYGTTNKSFPNGHPFRWKDGGEFGIDITNISNPGTTMTFTVNARPNTVVASSGIYGTISPKGILSVANGQSKTFNFIPNPGYEVDVVKINGVTVTATNPFVMTDISGTKTLSVSFKKIATQASLPSPWQKTAVGSVNSSDFVANSGDTYYLETYGNNIGGSSDNFTYAYQAVNGNGTYIVHLADYNTTKNSRVGLMIRESLQPDAAFSAIAKYDFGGATVTQRAFAGGVTTDNPNGTGELHRYVLHNWLKIVRNGNLITSYSSKNGVTWSLLGNQSIALPTQVYVGLFTKGESSAYPNQAFFDNISFVTSPAPSVSITSPADNAVLSTKTVTINAVATPSAGNGSITKVDFYNGTTLIGTDNTSPYSIVWNNAPGGVQSITAKATDNTNAVAISVKVSVDIPCTSGDPKIQGTVIGTPGSWNNSGNTRDKAFDGNIATYFDAPEDIAWAGLSLTHDYKVTSIRFVPREGLEGRMVGGKFQGSNTADFSSGVTDLATVVATPKYGWNCFDVFNTTSFQYLRYLGPAGAVGNIAEIEFYGTVQSINQTPIVSITSPITNSSFSASANISIDANASDADGSIVKVEFYNGSTLLGSDSIAPYSYTWTGVTAGIYTIIARAIDNIGTYTEDTVSNISVTNSTADITGPACASNNTTITYELAASKRANATGYGWYFTGSTQSFTPSSVNPYQATLVTGNDFGAGQLCVGVSFSAAPYHTTYCITVPKCSGAREAEITWSENFTSINHTVSFPNPFENEVTLTLPNNNETASIEVFNANGNKVHNAQTSGSYTFGNELKTGVYFVKISTLSKTETIKVVKK